MDKLVSDAGKLDTEADGGQPALGTGKRSISTFSADC
jgi:hypothetical protein